MSDQGINRRVRKEMPQYLGSRKRRRRYGGAYEPKLGVTPVAKKDRVARAATGGFALDVASDPLTYARGRRRKRRKR